MIIIFHCATFLFKYICAERKRRRAIKEFQKVQQIINEINFSQSFAYLNAEQNLRFDPPVYRQRYGTIHDVLLNSQWRKHLKKIVEFGCAELGLFTYIKNLMGITEINFVDINEELLRENLSRVRPLTIEYLKRRSDPLTVNVYAGSITDPDKRILDCDVVIGIEIIEHLYPDVLEAVPYTIFHCIEPKIVILTTPNADFNEILPNFKGLRHHDHKFEWTRKQFESWATNITDRFPQYFANFHGIGSGPEGSESLGCCSQMAVFVRKDVIDPSYELPAIRCFCRGDMRSDYKLQDMCNKKSNYCRSCCPMGSYGICSYFSYATQIDNLQAESRSDVDRGNLIFYTLLQTVDFPYTKDDRTAEQKMLDELKYKITSLGSCYGRFFNVDKLRAEIPLIHLTFTSEGQFVTTPEVQILLSCHGYKLEECSINDEDNENHLCVIYEPEMENLSSSESEASGYESGHSRFLNEASLSDWDDDSSLNVGEGQKGAKISKKTFKMDDKKRLKALHDSGLVKRSSITGSQNTTNTRVANDLVFESCSSMRESVLRKQIKAAMLSECKFEPIFNKESFSKETKPVSRPLPDPNKVNELDCLNNRNHSRRFPMTKTFFSQLIRSQFKFSDRKTSRKNVKGKTYSPSAIQSNNTRKRKKPLSDSEDDVMKDIKSIANCLLENTLNKLDIKESSKLIVDHIDDPVIETPLSCSRCSSISNFELLSAPLPSTSSSQEKNPTKSIKNGIQELTSDRNGYTSGSESTIDIKENTESRRPDKITSDLLGSSTEALFDPNSQADLLDDFDIPPLLNELDSVQNVSNGATPNNVILIGVNLRNDDESAPPNGGVFPDWLLQMLRTNFPLEGEVTHDGPDFYCQGDGLGVHPSIIGVDIDDDNEDASSESSSRTTGSAALVEVDNENTSQDTISLPDDSRVLTSQQINLQSNNIPPSRTLSNVENSPLSIHNEESDEYFDTTEEINAVPKKIF